MLHPAATEEPVDEFEKKLGDEGYAVLRSYTAKYVKIDSGYMGQLIEWPEVVTEGKDMDECRAMLRDALSEMILAYRQQGKEIPSGSYLLEKMPIEIDDVRQTT
ncbi:MAG: type II toxin-antitoxin system HicB family antitoxin [Syntrophobacteraceae bacterium]